jgi:imidazolonepropionase
VFCERGVFSVDQSRRVLEAGLRTAARLHADELRPPAAPSWRRSWWRPPPPCRATREGIAALVAAAEAGRPVVATLLPATSLVLMKEHDAPARVLVDRACRWRLAGLQSGHLADAEPPAVLAGVLRLS